MGPIRVAADDRSGAFETAGAIAAVIGAPVTVWPWTEPVRADDAGWVAPVPVSVVDLASRHLDPAEAARRSSLVDPTTVTTTMRCHKMDSTLRGNWAHEVVARSGRSDHVLVVPALPALGRTCVNGTVLVHNVPVHRTPAADDRGRVLAGARPAEMLRAAEVHGRPVVGLAGSAAARDWLRGPASIAVCDAVTEADLVRIAAAVVAEVATGTRPWPVVVGTSAVIAAVVQARLGTTVAERSGPPNLASSRGGVIVVCGSRHPGARRQLDAVSRLDGVEVLCPPDAPGDPGRVLGDLATRAEQVVRARPDAVVVVIGGDTAAAVGGDAPVQVHGLLAPGTAWGRRLDGRTIVVRSGGFGDDDALVRLVADRLSS